MSIGDIHRPGFEQIGDFIDGIGIVGMPEIVAHILQCAGELRPAEILIQQVGYFVPRIGEEPEDGRELHASVLHQFKPVFDRAFVGLLVRNHFALAKWGKLDQSNEAAAMEGAPAVLIGLTIRIEAWSRITVQHSSAQPGL